jgi:hypothetical protein
MDPSALRPAVAVQLARQNAMNLERSITPEQVPASGYALISTVLKPAMRCFSICLSNYASHEIPHKKI